MKEKMSNYYAKMRLPGLRIIKTAIAACLAALFVQNILHQQPFFACVGAVASMDNGMAKSLRSSASRNIATICGGLIGIAIASFTDNIFITSIGVIPLIMLHNLLGQKDNIVPSCIVYFAVSYLNTMQGAWAYGITRILGTLIGSAIAILVNLLVFPVFSKKGQEDLQESQEN